MDTIKGFTVRGFPRPFVRSVYGECARCGTSTRADGEPLFRCARCRIDLYCSQQCQQSLWNEHKAICKGTVWKSMGEARDLHVGYNIVEEKHLRGNSILIIPIPNGPLSKGSTYHLLPASFPPVEGDKPEMWRSLSLAAALGFPVSATIPLSGNILHNEFNDILAYPKRLKVETSSELDDPTGMIELKRDDGQMIHVQHALALMLYARQVMHQVKELNGKVSQLSADEQVNILFSKILTPKAFKKFFEQMKEAGMVKEPKGWVGVDCPVQGT